MRLLISLIISGLFCGGISALSTPPPRNLEMEKKIEALLAKMTLEEKIGQMVQVAETTDNTRSQLKMGRIGSMLSVTDTALINELQRLNMENSRLKIPVIFGFDVIHGFKTIFPIPLAEAASWDPETATRAARVAATEARAAGIHWTFAPMVDIARDPRWGRIAEGAGEDTYLGSEFAAARVKGFQGENIADLASVVACAKHYAAYGAAEAGRDYSTVDISERLLREVYLPPFQSALKAGVGTFMCSFNSLNGIPSSANYFLLTKILHQEWGFDGFLVSDWESVKELMNHGVAATPVEAAEKALKAGVDMDMVGNIYAQNALQLVQKGKVPLQTINDAVKRILRVKFRLGLFENPYADPQKASAVTLTTENLKAARQGAQKAMVLLKNQGPLLPLSKDIRSLALIGPFADDKTMPLGCWSGSGSPNQVVSILEGIKSKIPDAEIFSVKGCEIDGKNLPDFDAAVNAAKKAGTAILFLGESADMSGEAASRASLGLPGRQLELAHAVQATGVPTVLVLVNGRSLTISWEVENIPAILEAWHLGVQMGNAVADVLFGDYNPGGKLPVTFPRELGQVPLYYNHLNTGRPPSATVRFTSRYLDVPHTPLYPFGHGLSYTSFKISNLQISSTKIKPGENLKVTAEVENTGSRTGDEVVQLYIRDLFASVTRPVKELKGFQRVTLAAGEKKRVEFSLSHSMLGFYNFESKFVVEPGPFKLWVGNSSADEANEVNFELTL
jgi:beta-glucosidase